MITASIVLYNTDLKELEIAIKSFSPSTSRLLYLIDNSEKPLDIELLMVDLQFITYIFNGKNIGYGAGHNIGIRKAIEKNSEYHLVMNSDLRFNSSIIDKIANFMHADDQIGMIMPKILDSNGDICYLCKLIPTPFDLFFKRFLPFKQIKEKYLYKFQLMFTNYDKIMNVPYLSGCFMFLNVKALEEVGLFDERFFMYPEDIDLTRRIHSKYKTLYYPKVSIVHFYEGASYKSFKMLWIHITNMIKYFNKWGWFFDKERKAINKKVLDNLDFKNKF
ncbi:glycosyltransferase family protein [Treponema phagedenis]|uniref:glycosyltransferase n=1 Tax=Treponema phagedenis TaxID=162 RepID=UPI0011E64229|nr:glycosyltransferase [Treponema phagedenis]QEK09173.1 glycosyltransferase family 2 protein [Treponema phagedenis]TYT76507.1 glycosyltransferase family 2 protein [Treponema phagedenis]TYT77753.1 glycosyltransferase family 2 protein [Treponema phagedenis]